jgi:CheY-like chemotaxis protein
MMRQTIDRRIDLEVDLPIGLHAVVGDAGQLHQVLMNLCINARDALEPKLRAAAPRPCRITISARNVERTDDASAAPFVKTSVADNGIGMSDETRRRVFEPYFTTKGSEKGTGLGLAAAYGIIEQHGGSFEVQSEPDCGSVFSFTLPASPTPVPKTVASYDDKRGLQGSETILIVDDEELIRSTCRRILAAHGYRVVEAGNGLDAIRAYENEGDTIDVIVMDVSMPQLDGVETAARLRQAHGDVKVIFTTGYVMHDTKDLWAEIGSTPCIDKPFRDVDLLRTIRNVIDGARR